MGKHTTIYLSIGGNLGDRKAYLEKAATLLVKTVGSLEKASPIYETAAWGKTDEAPFLNQVLEMKTALAAEELIKVCLKVEASLGRFRDVRWGARCIDIDILFYGEAIIDQVHLQIPHPRLQERNFVLVPLAAIAPDLIHPILEKNITSILKNCEDTLEVVSLA